MPNSRLVLNVIGRMKHRMLLLLLTDCRVRSVVAASDNPTSLAPFSLSCSLSLWSATSRYSCFFGLMTSKFSLIWIFFNLSASLASRRLRSFSSSRRFCLTLLPLLLNIPQELWMHGHWVHKKSLDQGWWWDVLDWSLNSQGSHEFQSRLNE